MIGVILAAGMAKRLRPLTDTKPKCLLEVGGRTLLERTVAAMRQAGISEFVVVTGYRAGMIRDFLSPVPPLPRTPAPPYSRTPERLIQALLPALRSPRLHGSPGPEERETDGWRSCRIGG